MDPRIVLSVAVVVFSLMAKAAMVDQVVTNHKRKSVEGMSVAFFCACVLSYDTWVIQGALYRDWVLILGQGPGAILSTMIGSQAAWYELFARFGFRSNAWGHYRGRRACKACQLWVEAALWGGTDVGVWPQRCQNSMCRKGRKGRRHFVGLSPYHTPGFDGMLGLELRCDKCDEPSSRSVARYSTSIRAGSTFWLLASGGIWMRVSEREFWANIPRSTRSGFPSKGFLDEDMTGVIVEPGGLPPCGRESILDYYARQRSQPVAA